MGTTNKKKLIKKEKPGSDFVFIQRCIKSGSGFIYTENHSLSFIE